MDNDAIQNGTPVAAPRDPAAPDHEGHGRFSSPTRAKDKQHLNTLSIFYFIFAGLSAVAALAALILIPVGVWLASMKETQQGALPPEFGYFFIGLGVFMLLWRSVYAFLMLHAGKALRQQRRWKFVFLMAIADCVLGGMPGIVLGVFTIIVLNRPSVKELFAESESPYAQKEDA